MLTARDIMNPEVVAVRADQSARELAELFLTRNFSGAPVVDAAGKLIGIVTRNDLIFTKKRLKLPRGIAILDAFFYLDSPEKMKREMQKIAGGRVGDICTPDPISVPPEATLEEIATIMAERRVHTLPVLENGKLVGVIGKTDIIRTLLV